MVKIEINVNQIEKAIERLPMQDKIRLVEHLQRQTWQTQFKSLLSKIDKRKGRRPSNTEIVKIVKRVRQRNYANGHH